MTSCPNCGEDNEPGAEFCTACGEYLGWSGGPTPAAAPRPATPAPPPPDAMFHVKHRPPPVHDTPSPPVERPAAPTPAPPPVRREPASPAPAPEGRPPAAPSRPEAARPARPARAAQAEQSAELARVVRALDEGRRLAERHHRPDLGQHLEQARRRLEEQVLGVAIVGEFKRGKSTLVNALLQTDVCPTDADIVTAVPTVVRFGTEPSATALLEPEQKERQDTDAGTVAEPVDVDRLADLVSEAAAPGWRRRLRSVEVRLPHRLLRTGLSLVDTPGVGGLESAHGIVTLGALNTTVGVVFVTDASQELTAPELAFLRQALERCPTAVCVVTKTDLYPAWRRIVDLDREHLAAAGVDLPVLAVSSFLRLRAWRTPELNEESGFAPLFDWLRTAIVESAATHVVAAAARDLAFAQGQLRLEVDAEQQVLERPEASEEVVGALRQRSERTRRLTERGGNNWQQFLSDGVEELIADVKHDLAGRMRTVVRDVEAVIEQGDPKDTWPDIEVWLQRQVVRAANDNHELLGQRAGQLAADVAQAFALESDEPLQLGLTAPVDVLREMSFDPAQLSAPDSQKLVRMLFAGRAALIPATLAGSVASAAGGLLLLAAAAPVLAIGVGFIGRKLIRDERQRQLTYRRQQAKIACRRYLDEANFVIEKDCLDALRRTRRELRDEFQARAGVLHASSQRALSSAERAAALGPRERERRVAELADRRAEIERLGGAA